MGFLGFCIVVMLAAPIIHAAVNPKSFKEQQERKAREAELKRQRRHELTKIGLQIGSKWWLG